MYQEQPPQTVYVQQQQMQPHPGFQPQPQAVYMQPQPQPVYAQQPQPVFVQQQQQPVFVQQQPQPVYVQQQQPQPMFVQQPMMQPVQPIIIQQQMGAPFLGGGQYGASAGGPNPIEHEAGREILAQLNKGSQLRITYLEPNFRGDGGFKFSIFAKGSNNQVASGYTNTKGEVSIETLDKDSTFQVASVSNGSTTIFNPQTGQKDLVGTVALNENACSSWSIVAEKQGSKHIALQNRPFSTLFCILCPGIYLINYLACTDQNRLYYVDNEDNDIGDGQYLTDNMNSFREVELNLTSNSTEKTVFAILLGLMFMQKRVAQSIKEVLERDQGGMF